MDNVTHTLIGALAGETLARHSGKSLSLETRRRIFVPTLTIGSNLPDVDLLYTTVGQDKLDYLLHHRGHTHTILGALLLALALFLVYEWFWRRRAHVPAATERKALLAAVLIGPLLHVAMDATNSYGVHPYWPFDNRWRYGDAVFIVEPLFWAAAAPLAFLLSSVWARVFVVLALVTGVALGLGMRIVPVPVVTAFVCVSAVMLYAGYRWPQRADAMGLGLWCALTAIFLISGQLAGARLRSVLADTMPQERVLDAMRSPMPMNPVCWEIMLVQSADDAHFTVRRALLSLLPRWIPAATCPTRGLDLPVSAPLQPVRIEDTAGLAWRGELTMPRASLQALFHAHCEVRALMQFARIPWIAQAYGASQVGDLRYDREPGPGFAEIMIAPDRADRCPRRGAPWIPPRADLLTPLP